MPSQADQYCANVSVEAQGKVGAEDLARMITNEWQRRIDAARGQNMTMGRLDSKDVEVLTEWCRNKPEDAAIEILAMRKQLEESRQSLE